MPQLPHIKGKRKHLTGSVDPHSPTYPFDCERHNLTQDEAIDLALRYQSLLIEHTLNNTQTLKTWRSALVIAGLLTALRCERIGNARFGRSLLRHQIHNRHRFTAEDTAKSVLLRKQRSLNKSSA